MSTSTTSETCSVVDDEGGALGGGISIPEIISCPASGSVTSNSPEVPTPRTPLTTANLASHASPATTPGDSGTSGSVGSSSFDLLDGDEQAEILAMSRLQRRAKYSAARAEGRSARRTGTTRSRDSSVDSTAAGSSLSSDSSSTQSLVAEFENLAMRAHPTASNPNRTIPRPTTTNLTAPPYNLAFARELAAYLRRKTAGTPEIRGLRGWQVLVRAGGVTGISNSIPEIIRAIKTKFVNIHDVLAALESDRVATGFAQAGDLARYTFRNGKIMGKAQAKAKQMLKVFLKELS